MDDWNCWLWWTNWWLTLVWQLLLYSSWTRGDGWRGRALRGGLGRKRTDARLADWLFTMARQGPEITTHFPPFLDISTIFSTSPTIKLDFGFCPPKWRKLVVKPLARFSRLCVSTLRWGGGFCPARVKRVFPVWVIPTVAVRHGSSFEGGVAGRRGDRWRRWMGD